MGLMSHLFANFFDKLHDGFLEVGLIAHIFTLHAVLELRIVELELRNMIEIYKKSSLLVFDHILGNVSIVVDVFALACSFAGIVIVVVIIRRQLVL